MAIIKEIKIKDEFITLGQFLKITNLVNSGGEVKLFLFSNEVKVNGGIENRRGRKLYSEDIIEIDHKQYKICL